MSHPYPGVLLSAASLTIPAPPPQVVPGVHMFPFWVAPGMASCPLSPAI